MDDLEIESFQLFPNPSHDGFQLSALNISKVDICNLQGKIVFSGMVDNMKYGQELPTGIYIVKIFTPKGIQNLKWIKA